MLRFSAIFAAAMVSASVAAAESDLAGQEIRIGVAGPLTTPSATFGLEMRQAVDLAIDERDAAGGVLGGKIAAAVIDDQADADNGKAAAKALCDDPRVLAVVGHVNSGVMLASEKIYADCGLPVLTPMASNPAITEQGLTNVFRLTNRDDRKGPALARWLTTKMGKKAAVVVDDGTPYGKGIADQFSSGFAAAGAPSSRAGRPRRGRRISPPKSPDCRRISTFCSSAALRKALISSRICERLAWHRYSPVVTVAGASAASSSRRRAQRRPGRASASFQPRPLWARSQALLNSRRATRPASARSTITPLAPTTARVS